MKKMPNQTTSQKLLISNGSILDACWYIMVFKELSHFKVKDSSQRSCLISTPIWITIMDCPIPERNLEQTDPTRSVYEDLSTAKNLTRNNPQKASDSSYESLRLLVKRKDRDLDELREFVNLERESFISRMEEQQDEINCHVMRHQNVVSEETQNVATQQTKDIVSASEIMEKVIQSMRMYSSTWFRLTRLFCKSIFFADLNLSWQLQPSMNCNFDRNHKKLHYPIGIIWNWSYSCRKVKPIWSFWKISQISVLFRYHEIYGEAQEIQNQKLCWQGKSA